MSETKKKRIGDEIEKEIQPCLFSFDVGQLADPAQLLMMEYLDVRDVISLGLTTVENAVRLLGALSLQSARLKQPLFQHWRWRLWRHFGFSENADDCNSDNSTIRKMVAESLTAIIDKHNLCGSLRVLVLKLYNSFVRPLSLSEMLPGYDICRAGLTGVVCLRANDEKRPVIICSLLSLFAKNFDADEFLSGIYGTVLNLGFVNRSASSTFFLSSNGFVFGSPTISFYIGKNFHQHVLGLHRWSFDPETNNFYVDKQGTVSEMIEGQTFEIRKLCSNTPPIAFFHTSDVFINKIDHELIFFVHDNSPTPSRRFVFEFPKDCSTDLVSFAKKRMGNGAMYFTCIMLQGEAANSYIFTFYLDSENNVTKKSQYLVRIANPCQFSIMSGFSAPIVKIGYDDHTEDMFFDTETGALYKFYIDTHISTRYDDRLSVMAQDFYNIGGMKRVVNLNEVCIHGF